MGRWLKWLSTNYISMRARVWIPETCVNAGWVWQAACNSSLRRWRQNPQSELASETTLISEFWVCLRDLSQWDGRAMKNDSVLQLYLHTHVHPHCHVWPHMKKHTSTHRHSTSTTLGEEKEQVVIFTCVHVYRYVHTTSGTVYLTISRSHLYKYRFPRSQNHYGAVPIDSALFRSTNYSDHSVFSHS